jgi:hypothetical protein
MTVTTSAISFVDRIRRKTYSGHEERVGFRTAWAWHVLQDAICCSKKHLRVFGLAAEKAMPSYSQLLKRVHPEDRASFEKRLSQSAWRTAISNTNIGSSFRIIRFDRFEVLASSW